MVTQGNSFGITINQRMAEDLTNPRIESDYYQAVKRCYKVKHDGGTLKIDFGATQSKLLSPAVN